MESASFRHCFLDWQLVNMSSVVQKLLVLAAVDGLILQPLGHRNQDLSPPILIEYKTRRLTSLKPLAIEEREKGSSFEAHGVVGIVVEIRLYIIAKG